jgi:SHS2 domain-containing protein
VNRGLAVAGRWEHFRHESDISVCGETLEQAYEQAALELTTIVLTG